MALKQKNLRRYIFTSSFFLMILLVSFVNAADNSFTTKIIRDPVSFSSMNQDYISGNFIIESECEIPLKWIAITFNQIIQKNQTGSQISFKFSTDDFPEGVYQIQIIGETETGMPIQSEKLTFNFKHRNPFVPYIVLSIAIIVAVGVLAYYINNKKKLATPGIEDVKIE